MVAAFFDVDGTLSAPYYNVNGSLQPGMTDEEWFAFNDTYQELSYEDCKPIPQIKEYAIKLRKAGVRLFVLSVAQSAGEIKAKERFIKKHYPDLFEQIICVEHDAEKLKVMKNFCKENEVSFADCELVEDTYMNVIHAVCEGFMAKHITNILVEED